MHSLAPFDEKVPSGQLMQLVAPSNEYVFVGHSSHEIVPFLFEYVPAGHFLHLYKPSIEYSPISHSRHSVAPSLEYVPALHFIHSPSYK